jgi:RHS repeat-associated protein
MPHLPMMRWDFRDALAATSRQVIGGGPNSARVTTYYVYDGAGQRTRKITEGQNGLRTSERVYLGGYEIYREFAAAGAVTLERQSLHVMNGKGRIAMVETGTVGGNLFGGPTPAIRYQLANHLGSASLELNETAALISYEEYSPYGNSTYQAGRSGAEIGLKRYRYTGKERDEESGFTYHGARYCAPWLGRWTACDPKLFSSDPAKAWSSLMPYAYASGRPTVKVDLDGADDDYVSDLHNPIGGRFQAIADDFKTHGIGNTIWHRMKNGVVTETVSKATDFSHFTEVGPARQALLKSVSPVPLPYERPTVDPQTGATDYQGQEEWDKGDTAGLALQLGSMAAGGLGPPRGGSGPELAPAGGGRVQVAPARAVALAPPAVFAQAPKAAGETTAESTKRHQEEVEEFKKKTGKDPTKITEPVEEHHVASKEANNTIRPGGKKSYSELFREMFRAAGLGRGQKGNLLNDPLDDPLNKVSIAGHEGPHGVDYLEAVYQRLSGAVRNLTEGSPEYAKAFKDALADTKSDVAKEGTFLNDKATNR